MKKNKIFKTIIFILAITIIIGIIIYLFPIIMKLTTREGQIQFKEKISGLGFYGVLVLFVLQLLQIFLIILPGEPIEVLAGMCYGGIGGFILITVSSAIITTLIVFLVRKFGRKFVYNFFQKDKISKIEKSKMFKKRKRLEWIMIILFLIPGTPKDLLVYIAALLPINPYKFIIISSLARFPSVISSTLVGAKLIVGNWKISIFIYIVTFVIIGIVMLIIKKIDKSKATEDVMEALNEDFNN